MEYIKGHIQRNLKNWVGKQWYHQRFDGSPYFLHIIAEAEIRDETRKKGANNYVHYSFYDHGKADWYIEMGDIKRIYTIIIKLGKENPDISRDLIADWDEDQELFYKKCIEAGNTDLTQLSDDELIQLHNELVEASIRKNSSSSIIDGFALGTDEMIAKKIQELYDKSSSEMRFSEVFSILTAPIHLSFINEAEVSLLKVANEIKKDPGKRKELLEKHQEKYFWIQNNYIDANVLTVDYFSKEVDKILSLDIDIEKDIEKIQGTPEKNKKQKQELFEKFNPDQELQTLIKISEDFTYWQDERKKSTFWTTHYLSLILEEIGKRVNIPVEELKFLVAAEVSNIFADTPSREVLQQRMKNSAFCIDTEGIDAVTGEQADEIKKAILGNTDLSDVDDFRGLTACTGKAKGTVKILKSAKEIDKIEQGDILVAVMTRPDYVPAMKKAAAIVTDEGGITSHAAIVSRELGIPCIIGTKIATKVLKDGMTVEVNANHSWVRIVK